jgi:hypothetical protein
VKSVVLERGLVGLEIAAARRRSGESTPVGFVRPGDGSAPSSRTLGNGAAIRFSGPSLGTILLSIARSKNATIATSTVTSAAAPTPISTYALDLRVPRTSTGNANSRSSWLSIASRACLS